MLKRVIVQEQLNTVQLRLSSGKGGKGAVHFHRTRRSPRAGPDGGDGGRGGDLILSGKKDLKDFSHIKPGALYKAGDGTPGAKNRKKGAKGQNLLLSVPEGTLCFDEEGQLLKIISEKEPFFLKGGKGGRGNHFFKSSRRQAPRYAQQGAPAQRKKVLLKLP